jgi:uncharacterized protein YoaH (UPF0181 family)
VCIATLALFACKATSAGGATALIANKLRATKSNTAIQALGEENGTAENRVTNRVGGSAETAALKRKGVYKAA